MTFNRRRLLFASLAVLGAAAAPALAQGDYPSRPIEVIVGFPPGSAVDTNIRTIVPALEKILNTTVVVQNKPGAGGAVGWNDVANAKADGYTLGSVNYPAIAGTTARGGLAFDPIEKFEFLGNLIYEPNVIAVAKDSPHKTLADVIAYLKANPSGLSYGATGVASLDGLTAHAIASAAGVKFRVVNFEGTPDTVAALLGGHIDAMGMSASEVVPYLGDGSMRALGVGGTERNPLFPDVPTFAEQGYPLAINGSSRGFIMPKGADPAIVAKLREAIQSAAKTEEYLSAAKQGSQAVHFIEGPEVADTVKQQIEFVKTVLPKE